MKLKRSLVTVLLAGAFALDGASAADKEDHEPPRPRVLFVFAPDTSNKPLQIEYEQLQKAGNALDDSDILTVFVIGDRPVKLPPPDARTDTAANVRKLYHVDADAFRMVLIGKDGWQKMRWSEPVDPGQVMAHASEMPTKKKEEDQK
jgi:hypothetical protein